MTLCLDIGNSQIYGGVFENEDLKLLFRRSLYHGASSDEFGLFLRSVLRENNIDPDAVTQIALCSVVPEVVHSLRNACIKYFSKTPFVLQAGVKTGLKIRYRHPPEVGADRIANSIAATHLYPGEDVLIIDFGTATTLCAVSADKEYLGGVILAGLKISMEALEARTSKLPSVEIVKREQILGRSTVESIQSGLYFGTLGMVREVTNQIVNESFEGRRPRIIGTGGFASLFEGDDLFEVEVPDLVLKGLNLAWKMNL